MLKVGGALVTPTTREAQRAEIARIVAQQAEQRVSIDAIVVDLEGNPS